MNHILLDLEALSLRPGAAVIELAAVAFDLTTGATGHEFLRAIKPAAPFTVDLATLDWHSSKGTVIAKPGAVEPREAILHFLDWLDDHFGKDPALRDTLVFWSWGTTYDFPILDPLLDLRNPDDRHPWKYYQIRDARTVWQLAFGDLRHAPRPHEALADCRMAIKDLVTAHRELTAGRTITERLVQWDTDYPKSRVNPMSGERELDQLIADARTLTGSTEPWLIEKEEVPA